MSLTKFNYYVTNGFLDYLPSFLFKKRKSKLSKLQQKRVDYYNKLMGPYKLSKSQLIKDFKRPKKHTTYYFDLKKYLKYFSKKEKFSCVFGDVTEIPEQPSFVKSRPIDGNNENSILLKLNKVRHFNFINDSIKFQDKKDMLIGRAQISPRQLQRIKFYEMYFHHPMCNLGAIRSPKVSAEWNVPKLSIQEHLKYKFILAIEGYDVATSLKWIMSSNSIAVSPKLKYETWFMEGTLIPDVHFICIKDDYSDLEEKLNYYIENVDKALEIINNAHAYVEQFKNKKSENKIALGVIQKYFDLQES